MATIRHASLRDADELPEIERSSGEIYRGVPGLEWIADDDVQSAELHRRLITEGVAFVAEEELRGRVGFLNGELAPDGLHIWQLAVHPACQRRGIGRRLIEAAETLAASRGANALTLTTFRDVPWNEPYYRRLGFRTLPASEVGSRLRLILQKERQGGLPMDRRCAMMKRL
ncbi:GNAT family N-acetyltransferase [Lutibaculum baratangense]|nr:GNAT family N-acetyltransferase [Lutibaculum baratangense]